MESESGAMHCVFVGLTTLDVIHFVEEHPAQNQKIRAIKQICCAGGPATNAAITYAHLGGKATLASSLGCHPLAVLAKNELAAHCVTCEDLAPERSRSPYVASVLVNRITGDRTVIGPSTARDEDVSLDKALDLVTDQCGMVLVDGHDLEACTAFARRASELGVPVVFDGGSWKEGVEKLLRMVEIAICSEAFVFPLQQHADVRDELSKLGIGRVAVTRGERPILYRDGQTCGSLAVPSVDVVDTLAAGDIFHGAFCYASAERRLGFVESLTFASRLASQSCQFLGPRLWMAENENRLQDW